MDKNDYPVITISGAEWQAAQNALESAHSLQQLKAVILPLLAEASESLRIGDLDDGERIINDITAKLSAV